MPSWIKAMSGAGRFQRPLVALRALRRDAVLDQGHERRRPVSATSGGPKGIETADWVVWLDDYCCRTVFQRPLVALRALRLVLI